jgi:hypothetical protein
MKKYLLIVFGNFKTKKIIERIAKGMVPLVDTPHLKFQHTNGSLIIHFGSEVSQTEICDFLTGIFYGFTDTFILTEMTDKVSLIMSDSVKAHLLDLDKDSDDTEIKIDMTKMSKSNDDEYEMGNLTEELVGILLDEFKEEVKTPSLNELLDKINEKGIKSLSEYEKELLDKLSKNTI